MLINVAEQQIATLKILYAVYPDKIGDSFIEIREWETTTQQSIERVVEFGEMAECGDVFTQCRVVPCTMSVSKILEEIAK